MNIWTERLEPGHLPLLAQWLTREDGALTPNNLPKEAALLPDWLAQQARDPDRQDYLALIYDTPVGVAGLHQLGDTAELTLLLGERNYNPLRTATYLPLQLLDRAFSEQSCQNASIQVFERHAWYLTPLEQMGFIRAGTRDGIVALTVQKETYLDRKYLF